MRVHSIFAVTVLVALGIASTASADVQIAMQNGRVTLVAKDATVRQILVEWARVGQTKIVNVERVPGGPVTLELRDVPEQQALRVVLRSLGGYITAPRTTMVANASVFDRILVMPVTAAAPSPVMATAAAPAPPPFASFQPPQLQQQQQQQGAQDDDRDDAAPPQVPQPPGNRAPVFVFPPPAAGQQPPQQPPVNQPQPANTRPATTSYPGAPTTSAPVGVSVPGMIVPAPQQQPGQPGVVQPSQPGLPALQPRVP